MGLRMLYGLMLTLLLLSMMFIVFDVPVVVASGTIYIRADGSIDPPTAAIQRNGDIYTVTDNINDSIVVQRDNIVIEGANYTIQGTGSSGMGMDLSGRTNVTVKNTKIKNFRHGIRLYDASNNMVSSNTITANDYYGIRLEWYSNNNTVSGNTITNNTYGIWLGWYSNNIVYHNNFINNDQQVASYDSISVWDDGYPSGGNYWSDYTGVDLYSGQYQNITGSDGIGDTPYTIYANNSDRYPLMEPYLGIHDIAVTYVVPSKTVVGQGYSLNINVTAANQGDYTETFNVTLYTNMTCFRKPITITERSGNTLTDYPVLITVDTVSLISAGKMRPDCGDIRFKDSASSEIPYWIESGCNSNSTKIWVKIPSVPAFGDATIYMYYGNLILTSESNGDATFDFFDDFQSHTVNESLTNNTKWTITMFETNPSMPGTNVTIANDSDTEGRKAVKVRAGSCYYGSGKYLHHIAYLNSSIVSTTPSISYKVEMERKFREYDGYYDNFARIIINGIEVERSPDSAPWTPRDTPWEFKSFNVTASPNITIVFATDAQVYSDCEWAFVWADNVKVREYIEPEPTIQIGQEEPTQTEQTEIASQTVTFTWNTTSVAKGNYTISAYAWAVLGETYFDDNNCTDGIVVVTIPGDINGDYTVFWQDLLTLALAYQTSQGDPLYVPEADINGDGQIFWQDLLILALNYQKTDP